MGRGKPLARPLTRSELLPLLTEGEMEQMELVRVLGKALASGNYAEAAYLVTAFDEPLSQLLVGRNSTVVKTRIREQSPVPRTPRGA